MRGIRICRIATLDNPGAAKLAELTPYAIMMAAIIQGAVGGSAARVQVWTVQ